MQNKYWIWLSRLIDTVSLNSLKKLLEFYKSPEKIWNLSKYDLIRHGLSFFEASQVKNIIYRQNLENYIFYIKKENINIISYQDQSYPEKLKNIPNWPLVIYCKGNKDILNRVSVGMVGCRLCSNYGKTVAQDLAYKLAKKDIVVISGLARGIDTWSHIGCLRAGGKTIAVLGSGIDNIYPPENKAIFEQIVENNGAVISEYIVGTKPLAKNFPRRNRIISGLANGIVLVEAKKRSGSLITVDYALEQGKEVFAVPRQYNAGKFDWNKRIIKTRC